jgi:hypothetical protein
MINMNDAAPASPRHSSPWSLGRRLAHADWRQAERAAIEIVQAYVNGAAFDWHGKDVAMTRKVGYLAEIARLFLTVPNPSRLLNDLDKAHAALADHAPKICLLGADARLRSITKDQVALRWGLRTGLNISRLRSELQVAPKPVDEEQRKPAP